MSWAWLKSAFAAVLALKDILGYAVSLIALVGAYFKRREQDNALKEIEKVEKEISEAEKIANDKERLDEKAKQACELQKAFDPNSDC